MKIMIPHRALNDEPTLCLLLRSFLSSYFAVMLITTLLPILGCAAIPPKPPKTALQIRELQTRIFPTPDSKAVQKALFDVLQDEDYIVKNAVADLGLITATKETALSQSGGGLFGSHRFSSGIGMGMGSGAIFGSSGEGTWVASEVREITVNVSPFGPKTKVRVNVQRRVVNSRGVTVEAEVVDDPAFYQTFFSKVDKALFIQRERL